MFLNLIPEILIDDRRMQANKRLIFVTDQAEIDWVGEQVVNLFMLNGLAPCTRPLANTCRLERSPSLSVSRATAFRQRWVP